MRHRDFSLTIALCLSLAAHALALLGLVHYDQALLQREGWSLREPTRVVDPSKPHPQPAAKPAPEFAMLEEPPTIPPPPVNQPEETYNHSEFGDSQGKGNALHAFDADQPLQARKGPPQDQPLISRELAGKSSPVGKPPSPPSVG